MGKKKKTERLIEVPKAKLFPPDFTKFRNPAALRAALEGDLKNAMTARTPGGIEAQEAAGQESFVGGETLPIDCGNQGRAQLEKMGVKFGKEEDDLFVRVDLPAGWKKVSTDHSMWSRLIDEKGRERALIFYKAAFYDQNAHLNVCSRFMTKVESEDHYKSEISYEERKKMPVHGFVFDEEEVIFQTEGVVLPEEGWAEQETVKKRLKAEAIEWLSERFPHWEDPTAHWDDESPQKGKER